MTGRNDPPKRDRNCLHYLADDDDPDNGECRAHPPAVLCTDEGLFSACPPVSSDGWCGEHCARH